MRPVGRQRGFLRVLERFVEATEGSQGAPGGVPDDPERTPGAKCVKNVVLYALLKVS